MGWTEHYRRQHALDLALERTPPGADLAWPAGSDGEFDSRHELLLALQHRWSQRLRGRLDLALTESGPDTDHTDAVVAAWRRTAAEEPRLRAVLDRHAAELGATAQADQRAVALAAGLAEPAEPAAEAARIGAAFLALVRGSGQLPARRRRPLDQLFHRLVAS